jgi:hypothetical protein
VAKQKSREDEKQYGPTPEFSESRRNVRLSIVVTEAQLQAAKEVAAKQKPRQTVSSWGLGIILDALGKEGYKKW